MSDIGIRASISASSLKILPENFRVRDLMNTIPLGTNVRRASNESHSLLGLWMHEESPFSHRQLMVKSEDPIRKRPAQSTHLDKLSLLRDKDKISAEGYANLVDIILNLAAVQKGIENNLPLSGLTVREKIAFQEALKLDEEHFKWVLSGFPNAKFHAEAKDVVDLVQRDVHQVLDIIQEQRRRIKAEILPSVSDLKSRRLYV